MKSAHTQLVLGISLFRTSKLHLPAPFLEKNGGKTVAQSLLSEVDRLHSKPLSSSSHHPFRRKAVGTYVRTYTTRELIPFEYIRGIQRAQSEDDCKSTLPEVSNHTFHRFFARRTQKSEPAQRLGSSKKKLKSHPRQVQTIIQDLRSSRKSISDDDDAGWFEFPFEDSEPCHRW